MSFEVIRAIAETDGQLALVTVVDVQGSAPRHPGSKMVVAGGAVVAGTVGGGKGEARAIAEAAESVRTGAPRTLTLEFLGTDMEGPAMICGGTSRLIVEPLVQPVADRTPYRIALEKLRSGERTLLVKALDRAANVRTALLDERGDALYGQAPPSVREPAARALATGTAVLLHGDEVFLDPLFPAERLLVLGGGYVGRAVAWHASRLGFAVTVADDRPEFSAEGRFPPGVHAVCGPYSRTIEQFAFDAATYVVMVTRGHLTDLECARAVLKKSWRYAGFIGSTRKGQLLREQLTRDGLDPQKIGQLHSPIGLRIGAETPEELAVSILAEMIAVRRNSGGSSRRNSFDRSAASV